MTHRKRKLLIVEDEEPLLAILKDEFEDEGYDVVTASDGAKGLETAFREHPDLIILDIIMPNMDGMTMLDRLRADEWGKKVQVLILTNLEGDARRTVDAVEKGVFEFLVKTRWSLDDLRKRVREKLDES